MLSFWRSETNMECFRSLTANRGFGSSALSVSVPPKRADLTVTLDSAYEEAMKPLLRSPDSILR